MISRILFARVHCLCGDCAQRRSLSRNGRMGSGDNSHTSGQLPVRREMIDKMTPEQRQK